MDDNEGFEEKWPKYKEQLKAEHPHLSEEDLKYEPGKEEELLMRLQEKLKKTKSEIRNWLSILG
jgi:hypothetical protein